jgi:aspartate carbamoyltransferase
MTFVERSVSVVADLSPAEQVQLYQRAARIKDEVRDGTFKQQDIRGTCYLLFFEDSTRTKESFRNAAASIGLHVNVFDASTSSLNKSETIGDTVRMLMGYVPMSPAVFVVRSRMEGVTRFLTDSMTEYAGRIGAAHVPVFLNAGDGRHEHPTQEFLDEFTFLEQLDWSLECIHIALIGDLRHGRTVHSKIDGLRIFNRVVIDLIAPPAIQLGQDYLGRSARYGYTVNSFESLDEYFRSGCLVAPILYFTRLQLERLDPDVLAMESSLRLATTFRLDLASFLPEGCKIYHPLPRHGDHPEIPFQVDRTEWNGYDTQSRNGFYLRAALVGLVTGRFQPESGRATAVPVTDRPAPPPFPAPIDSPIAEFAGEWVEVRIKGAGPGDIRNRFSLLRRLTGSEDAPGECIVGDGWGAHTVAGDCNGGLLAALFFDSDSLAVRRRLPDGSIHSSVPLRQATITGVSGTICKNRQCVSNGQRDVPALFEFNGNNFQCRYCECAHPTGRDLF